MNRSPWQARLKLYEKRPPGSIEDLRRHAWAVLQLSLEDVLAEDPDMRRKAILAFWQGAGVYKGIVELDINARMVAIEEALHLAERNGAH